MKSCRGFCILPKNDPFKWSRNNNQTTKQNKRRKPTISASRCLTDYNKLKKYVYQKAINCVWIVCSPIYRIDNHDLWSIVLVNSLWACCWSGLCDMSHLPWNDDDAVLPLLWSQINLNSLSVIDVSNILEEIWTEKMPTKIGLC